MEIKRRFLDLYRRDGFSLSVCALDFKGSDVQRMGDLLPCVKCGLFYQKGFLVRHLNNVHGLGEAEIVGCLPKNFDLAHHTYGTPDIGWFLVEVITKSRKKKNARFMFYVPSKEVLDKIVGNEDKGVKGCESIKELMSVIESDIYPMLDAKEFFEKVVEWKFRKYVGLKEDGVKPQQPSISPIVEGRSHNKSELLATGESAPLPDLSHYFLEIDRQIALLGLEGHRDKIRFCLEDFIRGFIRENGNACFGKNSEAVASAVVFYYMRPLLPMTFAEFSNRVGVNKGQVYAAYKKVKKVLGSQSYDMALFISSIGEVLDIPLETRAKMRELLTELRVKGYLSGMNPLNALVGAWYYVDPERPIAGMEYYGQRITPQRIKSFQTRFREIEEIRRKRGEIAGDVIVEVSD